MRSWCDKTHFCLLVTMYLNCSLFLNNFFCEYQNLVKKLIFGVQHLPIVHKNWRCCLPCSQLKVKTRIKFVRHVCEVLLYMKCVTPQHRHIFIFFYINNSHFRSNNLCSWVNNNDFLKLTFLCHSIKQYQSDNISFH